MKLQHFSHIHPLVFKEKLNNEEKKAANCSGCGQAVSGPSFSCMACGFYLDKTCAEAPSELAHPLHRNHNLSLLTSKPHGYKRCRCYFCNKRCKKFVYHCSCELYLHIQCALFSFNIIAEKKTGELQIAHIDPLQGMLGAFIRFCSIPSSTELKKAPCLACWEPLLDSAAYHSPGSKFHLHKKCLELPLEINHLSHRQHSLSLQFNSECLPCQLCQVTQDRGFVYSCSSCKFVLDIACAELPTKINHLCHRQHPLILQPNQESLPCQICQKTLHEKVAYYCCSICNFAIHEKCVSSAPTIKGDIHEHPFALFWRQVPFTCDACGTKGGFLSYTCCTCGLIVHKECTSLPRVIKISRHRHHPLSHTFILGQHEFKTWECKLCPKEVNAQHGGYCCFDCNYIVHTKCGKLESLWYKFDDETEEESYDMEHFKEKSAFSVIKETKVGENVVATEIKHLSHQHKLVLSDDGDVKDEKFCDGCMLFISSALFYYCSKCNFFLHKSCAESPRKVYLWFSIDQSPRSLIFDRIFSCGVCEHEFNTGFGYENKGEYRSRVCLRCALTSDMPTCGGHEHRLTYYLYSKYEICHCNGCGDEQSWGFACKDCNFIVDKCLMLPNIIRHKCDEHLLKLTYGDPNVYSEHNYCDICEERRNPNLWFYHCASCDTSVHLKCLVGNYSFLKLGVSYKYKDHPHPLTLTRKAYDYPDQCHGCKKPCQDAALECKEEGCNYILHWGCVEDKSFLALQGSN